MQQSIKDSNTELQQSNDGDSDGKKPVDKSTVHEIMV